MCCTENLDLQFVVIRYDQSVAVVETALSFLTVCQGDELRASSAIIKQLQCILD
jgi:hypothetical protein